MNFTRNAREQAEFARAFYPDKRTLRNKLGIDDFRLLEQAERRITQRQAEQPLSEQAREMSFAGFKAIHAHLFGDLYEWAGRERRYTTGRGPAPFAPPEQVTSWMEKQFTALKKENVLAGLSKTKFADRAAHYVNEINAVHPFIDGNGRAQRMWLRVLADRNGFEFRLKSSDRKAWNEASRDGFTHSNKPMAELIASRLTERGKEQSKSQAVIERKTKQAAEKIRKQSKGRQGTDRER